MNTEDGVRMQKSMRRWDARWKAVNHRGFERIIRIQHRFDSVLGFINIRDRKYIKAA